MVSAHEVLSWVALTQTINEIKSPNSFLKNLLFSRHQTFPVESAEYWVLTGDRRIVPFVERDSEALMVNGIKGDPKTVTFPNIRLKMPFTASELLFNRRPGSVIYVDQGQQVSAIEQHIARDMQELADRLTNVEEYLCAQALTGAISYEKADESAFTATFAKPMAHTTSAAAGWDVTATTDPSVDFLTAKRLLHKEHGLPVTHCIMSETASSAFVQLKAVKDQLDNRRMLFGNLDLQRQYEASGGLFLGNYCGVDCWEYGREVDVNGSSVKMIREDYVEFVSAVPDARMELWYGAIPDMEALEGRLYQGERFSKSWMQSDPSVRFALVHSRPIPVMLKPGAVVSMDVIAS